MIRISIVILAYNPYPIFKESWKCLFENYSKESTEIIIVDNHSPDQRTRDYLELMDYENIFVIDPGKNIGSIEGFKLGFSKARGDVLIKYDDDVYINTPGFDCILASYVQSNKDVAYCSANLDIDPCPTSSKMEHFGNHYFREDEQVNFSLISWTRKTFDKLGELSPQMPSKRLYGDIEHNHRGRAKSLKLREMCCISLFVIHAEADERLLYNTWKYWFGYRKMTEMCLEEFMVNQSEINKAINDFKQFSIEHRFDNWVGAIGKSDIPKLEKLIK